MKSLLLFFICTFSSMLLLAQNKDGSTGSIDPNKKIQKVEAACGQCKFGLPGKSCDLAVRIDDKSYFVDGTDIDSHGDAHAKDGFCNSIRKAEVQGEIVNDRFLSNYFKLVKAPIKKD